MKLKENWLFYLLIICIVLFFITFKFVGLVTVSTPSQIEIVSGGISVLYNEFKGIGDTTGLAYLNDTELQDINDLTLENLQGKIVFSENVNLTEDAAGNIIDIDNNMQISKNFIEINTSALTSLEKPAVISLYGLNFSNPRVLRDGVICPKSLCSIVVYSGWILVFNISSFSNNYSAEEIPSEEIEKIIPSGGGGGAERILNFSLDKDLIRILIKQGETKRETIKVINKGNTKLDFSVELEFEKNLVAMNEKSFSLYPGDVKEINLDFFAKENEFPEAYVGRLIVKELEKNMTKVANIILEVKEKSPLFDLRTNVLTKEVGLGEKVKTQINIYNLGDLKNIDLSLYYSVKDFKGNTLAFKEESLAINDSLDLERELRIPMNAEYGAHVFYAKVSYENISAVSTDSFMVIEPKLNLLNLFLLIILIILVILIYFLKKKR